MEEENHDDALKIPSKKLFGLQQLLQQEKELEEQLHHVREERAAFVKALPDLTRRRIRALKKLQKESITLEAKFYEEIHTLSCKLQENMQAIHKKRESLINGAFTPNDDDLYISEPEEGAEPEPPPANPPDFIDSGVPDFWLTVLKSNNMTSELVVPDDEPVLQKLINIEVKWSDTPELKGFTLEFHFAPNEYFSNSVLTKTYTLKFLPDEADPFNYDGPEICKCKGCHIDWAKGKNITVKSVKKKQKHKGNQMTRFVVKSVKVPSFFNFFSPPPIPADPELIDEDTQEEINTDFEIGYYMKDRLIPRAVLYYTGEAIDESDAESEEEEYEDSEDDFDDPDELKDLIEDSRKLAIRKNDNDDDSA